MTQDQLVWNHFFSFNKRNDRLKTVFCVYSDTKYSRICRILKFELKQLSVTFKKKIKNEEIKKRQILLNGTISDKLDWRWSPGALVDTSFKILPLRV